MRYYQSEHHRPREIWADKNLFHQTNSVTGAIQILIPNTRQVNYWFDTMKKRILLFKATIHK